MDEQKQEVERERESRKAASETKPNVAAAAQKI